MPIGTASYLAEKALYAASAHPFVEGACGVEGYPVRGILGIISGAIELDGGTVSTWRNRADWWSTHAADGTVVDLPFHPLTRVAGYTLDEARRDVAESFARAAASIRGSRSSLHHIAFADSSCRHTGILTSCYPRTVPRRR